MGRGEWRGLVDTYLRPHRGLVVWLGLALLATIGLQIAIPQLVRVYIDRATAPNATGVGALAGVYLVAVLLQQAFRVATAWLSEVLGWATTNELRADLMAHCLAMDPDFHQTHSPGELIERVDGDLNGLSVFFGQFLMNVVGNALLVGGVLVVVWIQQPAAGAVLTAFAGLGVLVLLGVRRVAAGAWEQARDASAGLFGFVEERLAGTQDIRSCGAESHTLRGFYAHARDRLWTTSRARVMDAIPWSANGFVAAAALGVAFVVPAILVRRESITVGAAFVLYFYVQLLMQPLENVSRQVEQMQVAIAGGRRVVALLAHESKIVDGPGAELPGGALSVGFSRVTFGYGDEPNVLHDVTIDVPVGSVLGVVGRTGSGKSTLARLLVRLHDPREGSVSLGGTDLRLLKRQQLRERVALVTQEVRVLRASVRDNLTLFDAQTPDDDLLVAIDRLGLRPWFDGLPAGLDTRLGEGGAGMSAGEAQLLSFGRAFLADPSVVILDEASSRLDPATEVVLEGAVDALLENRTGILIAHRLATLQRCDTVCVLDRGHVVELGGRQALAADPSSRFGALLRTGLDVVPG